MPKPRLEAVLSDLEAIRATPATSDAQALLQKVFRGRSSHAVARAASIVGDAHLETLIPALEHAFSYFMEHGSQRDKGCHAKASIAEALYKMAHPNVDLFLEGIRYTQMEPVWGGQTDTASKLRGLCGMALVRINYADVLNELALSLADAEVPVRIAAAEALGYYGLPDATPLLRLKIALGDNDTEVTAACLTALLRIDAHGSLPFTTTLLHHDDAGLRETAALALGESRLPEAFPLLQDWFHSQVQPASTRVALLALALLRTEDSLTFLLGLIAEAPSHTAKATLEVLGTYQHDTQLRIRIQRTVDARQDANVARCFNKVFSK